jgi:hypothetical protein
MMTRKLILASFIIILLSSAWVWALEKNRIGHVSAQTEEYAMITYWTNQGKKANFIYVRTPSIQEEKVPVGNAVWKWILLDKINTMSKEGWEVVTMDSQAFSDSFQNTTDQDEAHIMVLLKRKVNQ